MLNFIARLFFLMAHKGLKRTVFESDDTKQRATEYDDCYVFLKSFVYLFIYLFIYLFLLILWLRPLHPGSCEVFSRCVEIVSCYLERSFHGENSAV